MTNLNNSLKRDYLLPNRVYDIIDIVTRLVLPAAGTLYFTLAEIWGWGAAEEVVGSLAAVATFFGVLISVSNRSYAKSEAKFDGTIDVAENIEGVKRFTLNLNEDPDDLAANDEVTFKVDTHTAELE